MDRFIRGGIAAAILGGLLLAAGAALRVMPAVTSNSPTRS